MSDKRYLGNIITQNPTAPAGNFGDSAAKGVWSLEEQLAYQKAGLWPVAGNFPLNVENLFSTYLYDGTNATQTITNGIDLAGEGGLVWQKLRTHPTPPDGQDHYLRDTERGGGYSLESNTSDAQFGDDGGITAFNSNGFLLGSGTRGNLNGATYASWTFRKAPKFFDIVTYTGDGSTSTSINHNLGVKPGFIAIKTTNTTGNWICWARIDDSNYAISSNPSTSPFGFGTTNSANSNTSYSGTVNAANATSFTPAAITGGYVNHANVNNNTYVAYLFAHNNNDGEFGPDADQDIIKCGSYTGNGSTTGPSVDLGFEPQWLLIRNADRADDWVLIDSMRGIPSSSDGPAVLRPESSAAEYASGSSFSQASRVDLTATGFDVKSSNSRVNGSNQNMIYIAIRRPTAVPESATEVFAIDTSTLASPVYTSGFPVDFAITKQVAQTFDWSSGSRLTQGKLLYPNLTAAEVSNSNYTFDFNDGWFINEGTNSNRYSWMWKRAPNYFDVVAYNGDGATFQNVPHNLGVAPEMMWVKRRSGASSAASAWQVYHKDLTNAGYYLILNEAFGENVNSDRWNNTAPTESVFTVGISDTVNLNSGAPFFTATPYIAYLFASLAGISKVGSVTHSGTTNVDCGFTSGARFILLKSTGTGDWYVWDSVRGIVAGNDPYLLLNTTAAEVTNTDYIDPLSSGFTITSSFTAGDYIFYAIA